ncbi:hypothetical protein M2152_000024 [Microbacteriaceae bacterium SG_E_30_P1]|uniref:DUF2975 domain-containing protein n=1 Tax=Antiquaquibacter oligotrophicus TaxID=2880260 RepID=A0ABT6KIS4_9MICO|nr:hypothetical protein [Antiquaquibacter oligotrophicus]MDH6179842.1 hypothetical protein [Antiquaquibacter oligotrophicus]UDF14397.1 hypothetical protein LH407_05915 [Antiquaquibacter oligotrophicus]
MSTTYRPKPSDRGALVLTIVLGAGVSVWTIIQAVLRIIQIAPNKDVPITAAFAETPATLPIGPGGASVDVVANQVTFLASDLAPATYVALILGEVVFAIAVVATVVCVSIVIRNLIRGAAFTRQNLALVGTSTIVVAFGWMLTWLFTTMGANGGAAALAGEYPDNTPRPVDPIMIFAIAALGALVVAFQAGYRLDRETEGLV